MLRCGVHIYRLPTSGCAINCQFFKLATGIGLGMRLLTIHTIKDNEVCNTHNGHNQVLTLFLCKYFHCREYRMRKSGTHTVKYTTCLVSLTNIPHATTHQLRVVQGIRNGTHTNIATILLWAFYNNVQPLSFFLAGSGKSTILIASSKISFSPTCVSAEHSM